MGDRLAHSSATGRWARAPAASASASATIIAEGEHASRMSRVAAFALGSATSGVGYLRLRERTWERPSALASGLRAVQDEIPGSTPIPQVAAPPVPLPNDIRALGRSVSIATIAVWNAGVASAHRTACASLRRSESAAP